MQKLTSYIARWKSRRQQVTWLRGTQVNPSSQQRLVFINTRRARASQGTSSGVTCPPTTTYLSPQRKVVKVNKRVSLQSPRFSLVNSRSSGSLVSSARSESVLTIGDDTNMSGISMNSKDRFKSVSGMPQSGGLVVQGSQASTCNKPIGASPCRDL